MSSLPGNLDLKIKQGSVFTVTFIVYDVFIKMGDPDNVRRDLTSKPLVELQARKIKQSDVVVIDLNNTDNPTNLDIVDLEEGVIRLSFDSEETAAFSFDKCLSYGLVIYSDETDREELVEGKIELIFTAVR